MRDYGKVHTAMWASPTFKAMSDDGRMLSIYLLTCQHQTIAGVFRCPDGYAAEDLDWTPERVRKGFAELFAKGFATRCERTKWVKVHKFMEWNPPENPNQRKAADKCLSLIPKECEWLNPSATLSEPFLNQKQEQKQEQEEPTSIDVGSGTAVSAAPPTTPPRSASPIPPKPPEPFDGTNAEALNGKSVVTLAVHWELPEQWGFDAEALGFKPAEVLREAEKFRQYWTAGKGAGTRRNVKGWRQTWSNWLEKAAKDIRR